MSRRPAPTVFAEPLSYSWANAARQQAPRPDGSWASRGSRRAGFMGVVALVVAVTASTASAGVVAAVAIANASPEAPRAPSAPSPRSVPPRAAPAAPAPRSAPTGRPRPAPPARPAPAPVALPLPVIPALPALPGLGAPTPPTSAAARVVMYSATWCGACQSLKADLRARGVPFTEVDVDRDGAAFDRAITTSGKSRAVPLTEVDRELRTTWIQGANGDGIERAYRGR